MKGVDGSLGGCEGEGELGNGIAFEEGISTVAMLQTKAILLPVTRFATKDTNGFFPVDLEKEEDQKTPEPFDETMRAISKGGVTDIPFRVCLASSSGRIPSVVGNGLR
ncbi:hypothetical protein QYF36_008179 [Acer negundo]|nr:hypothetical protein QYF36_008179 [Acer negundo]